MQKSTFLQVQRQRRSSGMDGECRGGGTFGFMGARRHLVNEMDT